MATHNLHVGALIPPHLTPSEIIQALHDHNTCLTLQALTTGHTPLPEPEPEIKKDTWWYPVDLNPIDSYEVTEVITLLPGIGEWGKRYLTFPTNFQNTRDGIKTRADAGGVIVRAEYRVLPSSTADSEILGEGEGIGSHASAFDPSSFALIEDVEVTCAWWLMPFVRGKMEEAHREICKRVIEKVVAEKTQKKLSLEMETRAKKAGERIEMLMRSPDAEVEVGFEMGKHNNGAGKESQEIKRDNTYQIDWTPGTP
ncbi:hypothetical protein P154DRAFT_518265 [Amniculicola lignicola CBS 123094]|uniref:DUF7053 domain-containing protein n=1 Tax=Amniculicola lignicola CBS 123094 TaxID=1392246 RepID=A0A6A5WWQ9_9PLEO|nr:hypothetical protein P154DRAFT_518265 [Amniculicola lignicola CBS 123094]